MMQWSTPVFSTALIIRCRLRHKPAFNAAANVDGTVKSPSMGTMMAFHKVINVILKQNFFKTCSIFSKSLKKSLIIWIYSLNFQRNHEK